MKFKAATLQGHHNNSKYQSGECNFGIARVLSDQRERGGAKMDPLSTDERIRDVYDSNPGHSFFAR